MTVTQLIPLLLSLQSCNFWALSIQPVHVSQLGVDTIVIQLVQRPQLDLRSLLTSSFNAVITVLSRLITYWNEWMEASYNNVHLILNTGYAVNPTKRRRARHFLCRQHRKWDASPNQERLLTVLGELAPNSCSSFRQLGCGFLPSRGIRREYSSQTAARKPSEIRGPVRKMRVTRTRCANEPQIRGY